MEKRTLWFVDTETGGLDCGIYSILSVGLVKWVDGFFETFGEWYVKESPMIVSPEALAVNQIDLRKPGDFWPVKAVVAEIMRVVPQVESKEFQPILGGHNTPFDVGFLKRLFRLANVPYPFSYRYVDTCAIGRFLLDAGLIEAENAGLEALCARFGVNQPKHTALGDAVASAELYTAMLNFVKYGGDSE